MKLVIRTIGEAGLVADGRGVTRLSLELVLQQAYHACGRLDNDRAHLVAPGSIASGSASSEMPELLS